MPLPAPLFILNSNHNAIISCHSINQQQSSIMQQPHASHTLFHSINCAPRNSAPHFHSRQIDTEMLLASRITEIFVIASPLLLHCNHTTQTGQCCHSSLLATFVNRTWPHHVAATSLLGVPHRFQQHFECLCSMAHVW